jgi:tRNA (guanosine-2'-O-)-methyltransferase
VKPSGTLDPKLASRGPKAVLRRLLAQLEALERNWEDGGRRSHALDAARRFAHSARDAGIALPPGARELPARLAGALERRDLASLIVPLERALDRRVRDEDFLPRTDRPAARGERMPVRIVVDSLRSAFNVGGVFRTGECFGVEEIVLAGYSATPEDPRVARAAMGAERLVAWSHRRSARDATLRLRRRGAFVVALESGEEHPEISSLEPRFPCVLLLGNERFGLAPALLADADARARIPTFGAKASLNVVAALAIALHELRRRFEAARSGASGFTARPPRAPEARADGGRAGRRRRSARAP